MSRAARMLLLLAQSAGAFTPAALPGLAFWPKADALSLSDGAAVSSWTDSSSYGRHATQATGAKQPTFKTNIINGLPVVRFDGGDALQTPSIDWTARQSATIYLVAGNHGAMAAPQVYAEFGPTTVGNNNGFVAYRELTSNVPTAFLRGTGGDSAFASFRAVTTGYRIMSFAFDKSGALYPFSTRDTLVYLDGLWSNGSRGWTATGHATNTFGNVPFNIGARNQASLFLNGDIAEIVIFDRLLTSTERAQMVAYLRDKYALGHTSGTLIFEGDSMTNGDNATSPYPEQTIGLIGGDWAYGNFGVNGQQLNSMSSRYATGETFKAFYNLQGGKNICLLWGGTNDMAGGVGNQSAATAYSRLTSYCATLRADGWKVAVFTALARTDASAGASFEARRQAFNTSIRGDTSIYDALVDLATDVRLDDGTDTLPAAVNSGDNVHLNNTGLGYVAALAQTAIAGM